MLILTFAVPASAQWVYAGPHSDCQIPFVFPSLPISVHAPGETGLIAVMFRLDSNVMGPEDVVGITPEPGVTIGSGDLFTGITVSWSAHEMIHETILTLQTQNNPPYQDPGDYLYGQVSTHDITLVTLDHGPVAGLPVTMSAGYVIDCFTNGAQFNPPDTVDVGVGVETHFTFDLVATGFSPSVVIEFDDPLGWIASYDPANAWGGCPYCPWDVEHVDVAVVPPAGTPAYTLYTVDLNVLWGGGSEIVPIVLRTFAPVGTEATTWGKVKALYREPE